MSALDEYSENNLRRPQRLDARIRQLEAKTQTLEDLYDRERLRSVRLETQLAAVRAAFNNHDDNAIADALGGYD
jgi:hypothetical protein